MYKVFFITLTLIHSISISVISQNDQTTNQRDANSNPHGFWIVYENGIKVEEGEYIHGLKTGTWKAYYSNGNIKSIITYQNGKPDGYACFYYEDGKKSEEGIWKENKWVGDYKYYYQNGNLAYEWKYSENGKRTGVQKYYHENGKIMIEGEWLEGKENGTIREYDKNGNLIAEKTFNNGQLDVASVKIYTPKAENTNVAEEKQEQKQNIVITEQKPEQETIEYFDGNGFHRTYKNGRLDREGEWKNGRLMDGKKYYYDENGKLIKTTIYKNGNVVNIIYNNQ